MYSTCFQLIQIIEKKEIFRFLSGCSGGTRYRDGCSASGGGSSGSGGRGGESRLRGNT